MDGDDAKVELSPRPQIGDVMAKVGLKLIIAA